MVMSHNKAEADHPRGELSNDADYHVKCQNQDPENITPGVNDREPEGKRKHFLHWDLSNDREEKHPKGSHMLQWQMEQAKGKQAKHFR